MGLNECNIGQRERERGSDSVKFPFNVSDIEKWGLIKSHIKDSYPYLSISVSCQKLKSFEI